jgi:DNA-binding NtrC family response regulator
MGEFKLDIRPAVLVVEDDKDMRDSIKILLQQTGKYTVETAADGAEALNILDGDMSIRFVLLDIRMPGMSGVEVLKKIKSSKIDREVIMVTAYSDLEMALETMRAGAYDYITKPFLVEDLYSSIDHAIERFNLSAAYRGLMRSNFAAELDRDRRFILYRELRMKRRIEGQPITPEDMLAFFRYEENEKEVGLEELKGYLEQETGVNASQDEKPAILVVEDEKDMRENLNDMLKGEYSVLTAENGAAALEKVNSSKPIDIVLLDIRLPDISGLDLLPQIKKLAPETDIIMVTAFHDLEIAVKSLKGGAYDYVTKPFLSEYLLNTIKRTVEKRYYQRALPELAKTLEEKKMSSGQRLKMLNDLCEKRKAQGKEVLMDDVYLFFPECYSSDLDGSFPIPPKTLGDGLKEFIENLKLRAEKMPRIA